MQFRTLFCSSSQKVFKRKFVAIILIVDIVSAIIFKCTKRIAIKGEIMVKKRFWLGVTTTASCTLTLLASLTTLAYANAPAINAVLKISTTKVVNPGDKDYPGNSNSSKNVDTQYFKSEFGEFTQENQTKMINATFDQAINEEKEGAILLYNKNNALPLDKSTETVSCFGRSTVTPLGAHMAAGTRPQPGYSVNIHQAMKAEGFTVNDTLYNILDTYDKPGVSKPDSPFSYGCITSGTSDVEDDIGVYTTAAKNSWVGEGHSKEVAVYSIMRSGSESVDMPMSDPNNEGKSSLSLHKKEKAILQMLKEEKAAGRLKKIVILLNTGNPLEVNWLEEYDVDACMFIGSVGSQGMRGVASILSGATNPSGYLVDTYAVNSLSAPACVNSGDNTSKYDNVDAINAKLNASIPSTAKYTEQAEYMSFQAESIYIGYKYYETRYEDCVLERANANSSNGASNGATSWQYQKEVSYPFGHGLSYTTFEQKLDGVKYNSDNDTYDVKVTVKNTGNVKGKSVVQIYSQTPFGDYEKKNKVEKAAVNLVDFGKTKELEPNESETLTISVDKYLLASYDYKGVKGYYLSDGDYYFAIGENAHDALNNILAKKKSGISTLVDFEGNSTKGDASKTYQFQLNFVSESYKKSSEGVIVTNQFDDCDLNYLKEGAGTYLSRTDWQATYPTSKTTIAATDKMMYQLKGDYYEKPENAPSAKEIIKTLDQNQGISFVTMKDIDFDDATQWDNFLHQMTLDELLSVVECYNGRAGVESVTLPQTFIGDGCDGVMKGWPLSGNEYPFDYEDTTGKYGSGLVKGQEIRATRYPSKTILTATFNKSLYERRGSLMGEEGLWSCNHKGLVENFGIGTDLHRTPFGGRSLEYCSEDANMTYLCTIPETIAIQKKGVLASPKHVAGNDQEFERHGVSLFFNEQAWREGSLRACEGALRVGKAHSLMQSFNRLGCVWSSSSSALNRKVILGEWGFKGHLETDGTDCKADDSYGFMGHYATCIAAGSDTFCLNKDAAAPALKKQIIDTDDGHLLNLVLESTKRYFYAMSRSNAINGLSSESKVLKITPWWQNILITVLSVLGVVAGISVIMYVITFIKDKKEGK